MKHLIHLLERKTYMGIVIPLARTLLITLQYFGIFNLFAQEGTIITDSNDFYILLHMSI